MNDDLISKRSATERLIIAKTLLESVLQDMPTAEPRNRLFEEVVVEYPDPDKCAYQEYKGKPYYSIRYREDGQDYLGFGTYKPEVLSRYLKEYFVHPVKPRSKSGASGKNAESGRKNGGGNMAEVKPVEVIMRIDFVASDGEQICAHAEKVQELIRCKDCKWYGRVDKRRFYRGMDCLQKRIETIVPDRDFCSRAERRTDG